MAPDVENDASYRPDFGLYSSQQNNVSDIAGTPFRHAVLRVIPADG